MLLAIQERIYKNTRFAGSHRQQGQYTITTQNDIRNGIKLSGTPDVPHFFFLFNVIPSQMLLNSGSLSACGSQRNSQETLERSAAVCARAHSALYILRQSSSGGLDCPPTQSRALSLRRDTPFSPKCALSNCYIATHRVSFCGCLPPTFFILHIVSTQ